MISAPALQRVSAWQKHAKQLPRLAFHKDFNEKWANADGWWGVTLWRVATVAEVVAMLEAFGPVKLLANLGEGLGGKEDQGLVDFFVNDVHATSAKMISG